MPQVLTGDAFPIAYDSSGAVARAATQYGLGRVVYFGHEALVLDVLSGANNRGHVKQLLLNAAFWASQSQTKLPALTAVGTGTTVASSAKLQAMVGRAALVQCITSCFACLDWFVHATSQDSPTHVCMT